MLRTQVLIFCTDYIFHYIFAICWFGFCSLFWFCWFIHGDAENGVVLSPFLGKFNSVRMVNKKGAVISFIDFKLIEKATNNFHESNILGEGGFGCVYKARLDDNLIVAVKKLDCATQDAGKEFEVSSLMGNLSFFYILLQCFFWLWVVLLHLQNEVDILSNIQHPNIISLLGYSFRDETKFIVYELMHNGSLETQLHGKKLQNGVIWVRKRIDNFFFLSISLFRSLSRVSINLAYADEGCPWYSKVSLFLHKIVLYFDWLLSVIFIFETVDQRVRISPWALQSASHP